MTKPIHSNSKPAPMGLGGWIAALALLGILAASIAFASFSWNLANAQMSTAGIVALVLGVTVSMTLGMGLMGLVFWSHRNGYDR
jgi:hypothetical protein